MTSIPQKALVITSSLTNKKSLSIIAAFCLLIYSNTLFNGMFWDDYDSITNNQYIRSWTYLPQYFTDNLTAGSGIRDNYWRPLLLLSFSLDYKIGGLEPFFYHLQNIFWHTTSSILLFILLFRLSKNNLPSLLGALLFAIHPLQTEAVTYVAGRADPMHTTLMLGSLLLILKYLDAKKRLLFAWSILFFVFALLTKERAIVLPVIISLFVMPLAIKQYHYSFKKILLILAPYFIIAAIYFLLRMSILHFTDTFDLGADDSLGIPSIWIQFLTYFKALTIYAGLLLWPARLYMEKTVTLPTSLWDWQVLAGIAISVITLLIIIRSWKNNGLVSVGLLWFFIALSPSLHIFPIQGLLYEHWLYPALPGLFLAICAFLNPHLDFEKITPFGIASICFAICILLAFSIRTIVRNNDWRGPIRFYEKNISLGGISARVYTNLGMAYDEAGKHEDGIKAYQKAIELDNRLFQPWYDMGNIYQQLGDNESALECYMQAIERNPYFMPAYTNSASIFFSQKNLDKALEILKQANEKSPKDLQILYNLAVIAREKGDVMSAKEYLRNILELDPYNTSVHIMLNGL